MERPQQIERCRECRGHVVPAGDEYVCTSCGVVARKVEEEKYHLEFHIEAPRLLSDRYLGSYVGDRSDKDSDADFNGVCTVGFAKTLSDHMGVDQAAWNCKSMIRRAADRLSVPPFIRDNAMAMSEKMLADSRENRTAKRRTSIPPISAYALLSAFRAAGVDHVSSKSILKAHADMGHRVTKSALLRLGLESELPFRPADPAALVRTLIAGLESNEGVPQKLRNRGVEPAPYFRRLLQASQTILGTLRTLGEGRNPRTVAAAAVYLASQGAGPKTITQKQVAEIAGVSEYTVREFAAWAAKELSPLNPGPS
jgi:transcription initiation factor TFIIIB Brf1 subunit/transcription initiation factor TFIIB